MPGKTSRPVGRPADPALATRILDAAWQMFLERGVEPVALEAVAASAGVSKATLYKHFPDKTRLFEAAVLREMERIEAAQQAPDRDESRQDIDTLLRQFGVGLMNFLVSPSAVDFYKALSADLARNEGLARRFYALGPGRTKANLAMLLRTASQAGQLRVPDPEQAAEHLVGLWQGLSNFQLALGIDSDRIRSSIPQRVEAGLQVFLAAYAR